MLTLILADFEKCFTNHKKLQKNPPFFGRPFGEEFPKKKSPRIHEYFSQQAVDSSQVSTRETPEKTLISGINWKIISPTWISLKFGP